MTPGRALFLTHEPPLPAVSGTRVRSLALMRQLHERGWRLALFSVAAGETPDGTDLAELESLAEQVVIQPLRSPGPRRYLRLASSLALRRAFHEHWFVDRGAARRLAAWLRRDDFDVIVAGQLYTLPYVPRELRGVTVLDCHNVEAQRVATMAAALWPRPRGVVARLQTGPVRRFEDAAAGDVAHVLAVSERERSYFEARAPGRVTLVPNGVDCAGIRPRERVPPAPEILFLGSLDYSANADAVGHLISDVLPRVRHPGTRLTIVGGGAPRHVVEAAAGAAWPTELAGRVPTTEPWFERSRLMAVPVRFGGGTRLKILESLARGVPVVTTTIGCEGLGLVHEHDALIADDPRSFADSIERLLADDELCSTLAATGRRTVEQRFDWRRIADPLARALEEARLRSDL